MVSAAGDFFFGDTFGSRSTGLGPVSSSAEPAAVPYWRVARFDWDAVVSRQLSVPYRPDLAKIQALYVRTESISNTL